MVPDRLPVGQESLILPSYAWTCRVGQAGQEAGMAMARVEAAAYVADHSISTSLTDPMRPLASGRSRAESSTHRPTNGQRSIGRHSPPAPAVPLLDRSKDKNAHPSRAIEGVVCSPDVRSAGARGWAQAVV
jgi:hypothetical protein